MVGGLDNAVYEIQQTLNDIQVHMAREARNGRNQPMRMQQQHQVQKNYTNTMAPPQSGLQNIPAAKFFRTNNTIEITPLT